MSKTTAVICPKCGNEFNVEDVLAHGIEEKFREKYNEDITNIEKQYKGKEDLLNEREQELREREVEIAEQIEKKAIALAAEREKELREKIQSETEVEKNALLFDLAEAREKLAASSKISIENERLKQQLNTQETELELKYSKLMTTQLQEEVEKAQKTANDAAEMKLREANRKVEVANEQVAEMKRKLEQGSVQLQGEVQELAIEEFLRETFRLDTIEEVKKGARGADCLQVVHTHGKQNLGSIYFESKRTKDFQKSWIEKFKSDMREKGATFGVLVTEAMPVGVDRMDLIDGVWVCSYHEFKGLSKVLRETIISLDGAMTSQENKGDKMEMLYSFLTGNEFKMRVEAIVEGFTEMQTDLLAEQRAAKAQWKKREKRIEKVLENTIAMHGSIRGIAGKAIASIQLLELPSGDEEDDENNS